MHPWRTRAIGLLAVAVLALVGLGAPASAQEDPYGSTTTTEGEPTFEASCELSVTVAPPGTAVTASVFNVPFGGTVRVLFAGTEVGRATAPMSAQATSPAVAFGGRVLAGQADGVTTVTVDFVIPAVAPGQYLVTAVGDTFTCECSPNAGGFEVLAATSGTGGGGGGALPRTGIYVALLVAIGLALLVGGRAVLAESRRRKRRASRQRAQHLAQAARRP